MTLSNEDSLRLNVLLRQKPRAIRIDDSRMTVHALTEKGEAKVELNPTCRELPYLKLVRELLSTHVLGSPGGYPVYLKRWTRLGQSRDDRSLERLLLLGEPEAVVAVVNSPDIGHELAALAWWAYPTAENARKLLHSTPVVNHSLGQEIATYLIEFLPFEEEHQAVIDSVRLILQPGLISNAQREALWKRARRKQTYFIGFLHSTPDDLPAAQTPHPVREQLSASLNELADSNEAAALMLKTLDSSGQAFLHTVNQVFEKLPNQDAAVELLAAIGQYFRDVRPDDDQYREMDDIQRRAMAHLDSATLAELRAALNDVEKNEEMLKAMIALSMLSEYVVAPIFGHTDAIGTVMRKKLLPVSSVIQQQLAALNPTLG